MGERQADRVKASTLRKQPRRTQGQQRWLDEYNARVAVGKTLRIESDARRYETVANAPSHATHVAPMPQLVSAESMVWTPTVPAAANDAAPPPPGVESAAPGAPIVDGVVPPVDESAALQFAMLIAAIMHVGIPCALELSSDVPMPEAMRSVLENKEEHGKMIMLAAAAAHRLALKYELRSLPMTDEIIVIAAVGGSAVCYVAAHKRRKLRHEEGRMPQASGPKDANVRAAPAPMDETSEAYEEYAAPMPPGFRGFGERAS